MENKPRCEQCQHYEGPTTNQFQKHGYGKQPPADRNVGICHVSETPAETRPIDWCELFKERV